jgi:hypothetical protein
MYIDFLTQHEYMHILLFLIIIVFKKILSFTFIKILFIITNFLMDYN